MLLLNVIFLEKGRAVDKIKKSGTEIGKHVAEKSKGLFSADDWQCSKYVYVFLISNLVGFCLRFQ